MVHCPLRTAAFAFPSLVSARDSPRQILQRHSTAARRSVHFRLIFPGNFYSSTCTLFNASSMMPPSLTSKLCCPDEVPCQIIPACLPNAHSIVWRTCPPMHLVDKLADEFGYRADENPWLNSGLCQRSKRALFTFGLFYVIRFRDYKL